MIIALLHQDNGSVVDLVEVNEETQEMVEPTVDELLELYNQLTGRNRKQFRSVAEGKRMVGQALVKLYKAEEPTTDHDRRARRRWTAKRPVALAREVFEATADRPRKEAVQEAIRAGVNPSTAQTQYSRWRKKREV